MASSGYVDNEIKVSIFKSKYGKVIVVHSTVRFVKQNPSEYEYQLSLSSQNIKALIVFSVYI